MAVLMLACVCLPASAEEGIPANLSYYYVQCDERWSSVKVGSLTIRQSACGICGICNAVYYLTGAKFDLVETAEWAHNKGYFNTDTVAGCYRSVFKHSGEAFGSTYGYEATAFIFNSITSTELIQHIMDGGTAVLHVPSHFMTLIDYDPETEMYLVIDSMPGDTGKTNERTGITHTGGDWLTAQTLSSGNTKVDGYALFTRILSDSEEETVKYAALKGLKIDS